MKSKFQKDKLKKFLQLASARIDIVRKRTSKYFK